MEPFFLFALLPLGLFSLFEKPRKGVYAGILGGLLGGLLPVVGQGVMNLLGRSQQNRQAQQQARQAQRAELDRQKAEYFQQNYSPQAQASQSLATLQLGRLAGAMGGINNVPASLRNLLNQRRTVRPAEYNLSTSQANIPRAPGNVGTDFLSALSSFDVSALNRNRNRQQ